MTLIKKQLAKFTLVKGSTTINTGRRGGELIRRVSRNKLKDHFKIIKSQFGTLAYKMNNCF